LRRASVRTNAKHMTKSSSFDPSQGFTTRFAALIVLLFLCAGVAFYHLYEGWDIVDSVYFCIVTFTTVGYGDFLPLSDLTKAFTVVYMVVGVTVLAQCLGVAAGQLSNSMQAAGEAIKVVPKGARPAEGAASRPRPQLWGMIRSAVLLTLIILVGAACAWLSGDEEKIKTKLDAIYWATATCTTVGYGDMVLTTENGRLFGAVFMLIGVALFAEVAGRFGMVFVDMEKDGHLRRFVERGVTESMIEEMDADHSGNVDRVEFLRFMLVKMGAVEEATFDRIDAFFTDLDADGSGTIDTKDIRNDMRRKEKAKAGATDPALVAPLLPATTEA